MLTLAPEGLRGRDAAMPLGYNPAVFEEEPQRVEDFGKQLLNSGVLDWALDEIPGTGVKRVEDRHAARMAMVLWNQLRFAAKPDEARRLGINPVMEDIQTSDLALPTKWSLPIIRRIYPAIFDSPFFATQSMPGPLAYAFFLDFKREVDGTDLRAIAPFTAIIKTAVSTGTTVALQISTKSNAIGYGPYQIVAGQSISLSYGTANVETFTVVSINDATGVVTLSGTITKAHAVGEFVYISAPSLTSEGGIPSKGKMQLSRSSVTAQKWMMAATWTTEAMEDARAQLNLDVEAEVIQALSTEIGRELFATILGDIIQGATGGSTAIAARGATNVQDYRFLALQPLVDAEQNIFVKRFHDADTILCGVDLAANIQQQDNWHSAPSDKSMLAQLGVTHLGTFQGKYEVYKSAFLPGNLGLFFQKPSDWLHAGYVFMPYIPLSPMPLVYAGYNTGTGNYQNTDEWTRNIRTRAGRLLTVSDEYGILTLS